MGKTSAKRASDITVLSVFFESYLVRNKNSSSSLDPMQSNGGYWSNWQFYMACRSGGIQDYVWVSTGRICGNTSHIM